MKPEIFTADKEKNVAHQMVMDSMMLEDVDVKDRHILITGASKGIGHTLAIVAAAAGAKLILLDKSVPALESLYEDVMQVEEAHEPFLLPIDLAGANLDDYLQTAELLEAEVPQLDGIIHNAAYFSGLYALLQTPPEVLIKQIHVNYTAPIWLTQAMFTLLKKSKHPTLLFADHQESHEPEAAYWNTYAGSKVALMQAVKQIALEQGESYDLFAYGYNTGWVNTELARDVFPHANPDWPLVQDAKLASQVLSLFAREHDNGSIVALSQRGVQKLGE